MASGLLTKVSNKALLARRGGFTREASDEGRHSRGEDQRSRGRAMNNSTTECRISSKLT